MALKPRRILVATGLGVPGEVAVRAGAVLAKAHQAALAIVHAMPSLEMVRPIFADQVAGDALRQATLPMQVRQALDRHLARCAPQIATGLVFLETGPAAEMTLAVADRWEADLIVTEAPEEGTVDVERVVRHAHVPVLIARPGPERGPVFACTDFSDPALPAVHAAAEEARRTGDPLCVVHALEPLPVALLGIEGYGIVPSTEYYVARRVEAERRLAQALSALEVAGEYVAVDGPAVRSLVAIAREREARLLVIGTVGRTGLNRFLLGSVAEALVRSATCSTLVVRLQR